jgi:predicted permease
MRFLQRIAGGLRALFQRTRLERELDEELRAYLESTIEGKMAAGMTRAAAERAALVEIGSVAAVKDHTRDAGWESAVESLVQDVRYAARALRRAPGFTAVAILTLALGIGANTAIFSVVDAMLIHPLTDDVRMRLVRLYYTQRPPAAQTARIVPSLTTFARWQRATDAFDGMAVHRSVQLTLLSSTPERVRAIEATPQLFALFDASPERGRFFNDSDAAESVAVISYGAWHRRFGSDPEAIGRRIPLLEGDRTIIGVLPPTFAFQDSVDFWLPLAPTPIMNKMPGWGSGSLIARLKPGVTLDQARQDMASIARRFGPDATAFREYPEAALESLHESAVSPARPMLLLLMGATGFTLLLACVNVAGLLVARGVSRSRELAVRAAIGAGRLRIARQLLTESVVLGVLGGIAGALLARWTLDTLIPMLPVAVPSELTPSVDLRVLVFTLVVSIVTGGLFGLLPAVRLSKPPRVVTDLKDGSHGSLRWASTTGTTLVVVETALALVLLTGAGLMVRSLQNVLAVDPGFDATHTLVIEASPVLHQSEASVARVNAFYEELTARIRALPGVEAVGAVDVLPFWSNAMGTMEIDGPAATRAGPSVRHATPGYFRAIGMRVIAGRDFTPADRPGSTCVAIVNQKAAREYWPGTAPLGGRLRRYRQSEWCEVVGVVNDIRHEGFERDSQPEVFFAALQGDPNGHHQLAVVARASNAAALTAAARTQTAGLGAPALVEQIAPFEAFADRIVATRRSRAVLLSFLGALGAVLAALGIFGIASYAVARKTSEIGIRVALGATRGRVLRTVMGSFAPAVTGGVLLGLVGSAGLARMVASTLPAVPQRQGFISSPLTGNEGILFGVAPNDPLTFGALSVLLLIVGLLACYLPARRAMRVDPMVALRCE